MHLDDIARLVLDFDPDARVARSALDVAVALGRATGGAILARKGDQLKPLASTLGASGEARAARACRGAADTAFVYGSEVLTVPFVRVPISGRDGLAGELYLEGVEALAPGAARSLTRCVAVLSGILSRAASAASSPSRGCA